MARKPPRERDEGPVLDLEEIYTHEQLSPALAAANAELGIEDEGQVMMYVSKVQEDAREARVWQGPPADYDLNAIAKRFGSGDYVVKLYAPHPTGKLVKRGSRVFPMLLSPEEDAAIAVKRRGEIAAAPGAVLTPDMVRQMIVEAVRGAQSQQPSMFDMMDRVAGMFAKMMPQQPANPLGGMQGALDVVLGITKAVREMSPSAAPGVATNQDGNVDVGGTAMVKGIELISNLVAKHLGGNGAPALASPETAAPAAPEPTAEEREQQEQIMMLQLHLRTANKQAAAGADPEEFAEGVYSIVPDDVLEMMYSNAQWFELLSQYVPECKQFEPFYRKVREKLVAMALEDGVLTPGGKGPTVSGQDVAQSADGAGGAGGGKTGAAES